MRNGQNDVTGIVDSTGVVVVKYSYDAWGKQLSVTDGAGNPITNADHVGIINPIRYRGYYYETETGYYYLNSRYYNPEIGRFINSDGKMAGVGESIQGYNLFAYCFNNPVNLSDENGDWPQWLKDIGNGIKDGFVDTFSGIANAIAHPVQTVKSIGSDPLELLKQGVINTLDPFRSYRIGYNLIKGDMYNAGHLYGGNLADATIVAGTMGATKAVSKITAKVNTITNPLSNIKYTSKVKMQMELGDNHSFPKIVDNYGGLGFKENIVGGDGVIRAKVSISGAYNGKIGIFEYIIEPDGTCNHRLFKRT